MSERTHWDAEEIGRACALHAQGASYGSIGEKLGRTAAAVRTAVRRASFGRPDTKSTVVTWPKAPRFVLEERERRLAIQHTEITAMLMGDPLPGFSQLDRRHQMKRGA